MTVARGRLTVPFAVSSNMSMASSEVSRIGMAALCHDERRTRDKVTVERDKGMVMVAMSGKPP